MDEQGYRDYILRMVGELGCLILSDPQVAERFQNKESFTSAYKLFSIAHYSGCSGCEFCSHTKAPDKGRLLYSDEGRAVWELKQ